MMEYLPHNNMEFFNPIFFDVVFVLGFICFIIFAHWLLKFIADLLISVVLTTSATYVFALSAYQKIIHTNGVCNNMGELIFASLDFAKNNFMSFVVSVDNDVEFISEDFYWKGLFNYKTYNMINQLS